MMQLSLFSVLVTDTVLLFMVENGWSKWSELELVSVLNNPLPGADI
jgi:hypothetical protein